MPRPSISSIQDLFSWKEADSPPDTQNSEVVRFFATYLCIRWRNMFATWRDYPRYPPEMVVPGYKPNLQDDLMAAACPGDYDRWAGALVGLYFADRNDRMRSGFNLPRMTAALADINQQVKKYSGPLFVRYLNSLVIFPSLDNGNAYKALLLDSRWRTMTAAKQAAGTWRNPSWEMFNHWAKLVACSGSQRQEVPAPTPQSPTAKQVVDKSVYDVYNTLRTQEPKLDLAGYSDITPTRWESYSGWALSPIKPDIIEFVNDFLPKSEGPAFDPRHLLQLQT